MPLDRPPHPDGMQENTRVLGIDQHLLAILGETQIQQLEDQQGTRQTIVKLATFNARSLLSGNRLSGRRILQKLSRQGCILLIQDSQITPEKYSTLKGLFPANINFGHRVFSTESSNSGGTTIIFPQKAVQKFHEIYAIDKNVLFIHY